MYADRATAEIATSWFGIVETTNRNPTVCTVVAIEPRHVQCVLRERLRDGDTVRNVTLVP